ncbi:Bacterial alpha-L-rhamnosidase [Chitinophaga sp. SYP-B3965]|uniref:alpha-L-rhamnosidase-related protein n=1 Tax=Chitinophaga sp. SYP-B3965 TaxID=2663120 RepID=UPI001299D58D|nr:alpha-L-rhamnosidase C-terminal domain-containing protein [Chitinophaga sp. SYP-B3965]MRG48007.1 Bacterial alpha-L-rhamnosidase [Chitinophaga sp. SYP-B3965]
MRRKIVYILFLVISVIQSYAQQAVPEKLMCDLLAYTDQQYVNGYPVQPVRRFSGGQFVRIANRQPAFSWAIGGAPVQQTAYRILVSENPENQGNVWDSKKVTSAQSAGVVFAGNALKPNTTYYWMVQIWDEKDQESRFSSPAIFFTDSVMVDYATAKYPLQKTDQFPVTVQNNRIDFGKAAFGQLKLRLSAKGDTDTVSVHLGEVIKADGSINRQPGGSMRYQVYRLPLRAGTHTYQVQINPDRRNTGPQAIKMPAYIGEVLPFRYCELEGYSGTLQQTDVIRAAVHYPFNDAAADFQSADTTLNAVWELCKYSMKATSFAGVYVDGDRERIPYEADAYINQLGHYATDREYSLARSSHEYLLQHATWPTEWILQSVLMAYNDYLYTGDIRSARHNYTDLKAKLLMPLEDSSGLISTRTGRQTPALLESIHFNGNALRDIVDWPHTGILGLGNEEGGETDGFIFTNHNAVVNAYYYKALRDMQVMAGALGNKTDESMFAARAEQVKKAFRKLFWDAKRKLVLDGSSTTHASLHANMFAMVFGLVEEQHRKAVGDFIRSRGMACSVYGSQFLMDAVYDAGDEQYGLSLLASQAVRSWYNMIRAGSTITMEAWDNKYKPNQDWNHAWGAVPANIIPRKLMGIEPLTPGWSSFRIKPQPGDLPWAKIKVPTIKGDILVAYEQSAGKLVMKVTIPANTTAQVVLPAKLTQGKFSVMLDTKTVKSSGSKGAYFLSGVSSGMHEITINQE